MFEMENLAMSIRKINPMIDIWIICPGVIYGSHGFDTFELFKQSWLEDNFT